MCLTFLEHGVVVSLRPQQDECIAIIYIKLGVNLYPDNHSNETVLYERFVGTINDLSSRAMTRWERNQLRINESNSAHV